MANYTTITGTVKDPNGVAYQNGTFSVNFVDPGTSGKLPTLSFGQVFQKQFSGSLDGFGFFTVTIADNGAIATASGATGTSWQFFFSANASILRLTGTTFIPGFAYSTVVNCATNTPGTCSSGTIDISAQVQAVAATLPVVQLTTATSLSGPGTVAGTFAGNHTLTGNVTFQGTGTHSGTETFTGAVNVNTPGSLAVSGTGTFTGSMNANAGGALSGTFTGPTTLSNVASETATTLSVITLSAKSFEALQFCDQFAGATADVQINAAIAALPANGGTVDCRGYGATTQTVAATINLGSATKSVTMIVDRTTTYNCIITNGTPCLKITAGSGYQAPGGSTSQPNAGWSLPATASVSAVVQYSGTGLLTGFELDGLFVGPCTTGAVVSDAVVSLPGVLQPAHLYNLSIGGCANTALLKIYATAGGGAGDIQVWGPNIDCSGKTGCLPVWIGCTTAGSLTGSVSCLGVAANHFYGGIINHPGAGGLAAVTLDARNGAGGSNQIAADGYGVHIESINTTDIGWLCLGCEHLGIYGGLASASTNNGADFVKVTSTAGLNPDGVDVHNVDMLNTWTNCVNNTVSGFAIPASTTARCNYSFGKGSPDLNANVWEVGTVARMIFGSAGLTAPIGAVTNNTGLQIFNTTATCTTAASVGATCTTAAITLPVAEADTAYRVSCTGKGVTNVPVVIATTNSSATQFTITIAALTAAAASFNSYDCIVGHN